MESESVANVVVAQDWINRPIHSGWLTRKTVSVASAAEALAVRAALVAEGFERVFVDGFLQDIIDEAATER